MSGFGLPGRVQSSQAKIEQSKKYEEFLEEKDKENFCNKIPTPAPPNILGKCIYYKWRNDNFLKRHKACEHTDPPVYYLDYGFYYCEKFTNELFPKLSKNGQKWLAEARRILQIYMEDFIEKITDIELNNEEFTKTAFETHSPAYIEAGILELSFIDKLHILWMPDAKEWLKKETWIQAGDVTGKQFQYYYNNPIQLKKHISGLIDELIEYFEAILFEE